MPPESAPSNLHQSERPSDHDRRMAAAERRAEWELGSRRWAGIILAAYWNPDEDAEALTREQDA